jgi:hypothetical protein
VELHDSLPSEQGHASPAQPSLAGLQDLVQTLNNIGHAIRSSVCANKLEIKSYSFTPYNRNSSKPTPYLNNELNPNPECWKHILELASKKKGSIIYHYRAVECLSKTDGRNTPGYDQQAFIAEPGISTTRSNQTATAYLAVRIKEFKHKTAIAKGKSDPAIIRKGLSK